MKLGQLLNTIRYLRPVQVYYQLFYRLRRFNPQHINAPLPPTTGNCLFSYCMPLPERFTAPATFTFLNRSQCFQEIDWNFSEHGKLWTYNLNYFEFLHQENFSKEEGLRLLHDFIDKSASHKDAYEPYPIALRLINWVKFLTFHKIEDPRIDAHLFNDALRLTKQLEYHLMANHLLEDGFGLLFAAYYFQNQKWYDTAEKILKSELKEQLLPDGAHYELTPMYHHIILGRCLDALQLVQLNKWNTNLRDLLHSCSENMLSWMNNIAFKSGAMPFLNDTTNGVAPTRQVLQDYAGKLGVKAAQLKLGASGYRKLEVGPMELLFDLGQLAPSYQPGHAHADNLNVLLAVHGQEVLVDTGISTYDKNERRQIERSTFSHNTLTVNGENSSQVWGGFRVGRRAVTTIEKDSNLELSGSHNGYRNLRIQHRRSVKVVDEAIHILDMASGAISGKRLEVHFHFSPEVHLQVMGNKVLVKELGTFTFYGECTVHLHEYQCALGYNQLQSATKIIVEMHSDELKTIIQKEP